MTRPRDAPCALLLHGKVKNRTATLLEKAENSQKDQLYDEEPSLQDRLPRHEKLCSWVENRRESLQEHYYHVRIIGTYGRIGL